MKSFRHAGVLTTVVASSLTLAACASSSTGAGEDPAADNAAASSSSSGGKRITLMVGVKGDPFYTSMQCGAQEAATKAGVTLDVQGPDKFDATIQNPMLDSLATAKPDALLVAPDDVKASASALRRLQDAGTKIVLVDTVVDDPDIGLSRISTDNKLGGQKAAEALMTLGVPAGGEVLVMSTYPGVSSVDARVEGFKEKATALGYKLVTDTQYSHDKAAKATSVIKSVLAKSPHLVGVFAANVATAEGVATGIKQKGKSGKIKIVGFDAGPAQMKQLQDGAVQALVAQKPFDMGSQGIEQAMTALSGGSVTAKIETESLVVTKANMNDPSITKYLYKSSC